jgi:HD-GYP domain-containing protein (c-di-GMP phosphodiesterase class II)
MRRFPFLLGAGVAAAVAPAVVHLAVGFHHVEFTGTTHVYTVGFSAFVAVVAAVGLTAVGARRGDTRTMVVGTAFAVMAGLLALHGFSTPGVWFGNNGVVAITGGATLPAGAIVLVFSVLPLPRVLRNVVPFLLVEAVLLATVLALGISALVWPSLLPPVPAPGGPDALALLAVGMVAFALVTWRAVRTFLLTRRVLDLAVAVGLVWLATALVPALTMDYSRLGWWIGHEVELDGILVIGIAVAIDLAKAAQSRPLVGDLTAAELVASEDLFLGSQVRALTVTLAEKDEYTERHTRRVALRAVQVGDELGLSRGRLRTLAIGGLVHDIGKLSIPDGILVIGIAVAIDLAKAAQSRPLVGDLTAAELVASEDLFLGSQVRALTVTLAEKDEYTERHTRRVALRAVQVGDELGLSRGRLRTLAIGGLVHDIGKLSIPDEILKKPGPLDDDEYAIVKQHSERGYRLLTEIGGFGEGVRDLVRDHHERLDGKGYPRGLSAGQLTLDARILAVCDVYDALISKRVYREAWSERNAIDYLRAEAGTAFDERCVEALARVVGREPARATGARVATLVEATT